MSDDNEKELVSANLKAKTALGKEFQRQWKAALQTRRTEQVGDYSLAKLLVECHAARDDKTTCEEQQLREHLAVEEITFATDKADGPFA